jgi:hypothetical protein
MFKSQIPTYFKEESSDLHSLLDLTVKAHDKLIEHRGVIEGTKRWKAITLYATELLEGRNPDNPGWVAVGRVNKWPKLFSHLRPLFIFIIDNVHNKELEGEIAEARRLINTLFKLNKVCEANAELESHLVAIRGKHKLNPDLVGEFEQFARTKLADIRERITLTDISFDIFLGPSNGPNKVPKLSSALEEAAVLRRDVKLYEAFKEMCITTGNTSFLEFFEQCSKKYQNLKSLTSSIKLRKICAIPDKGNKSRAVAIVDFWTNSVCAELERVVNEITMKLYKERCCFYSHREGWDDISSQTPELQNELKSLDASSWTDNFPAALQLIVVKALFGQKLSNAWKHLVVTCPWYIPKMPKPVYYGKGQGMGTKGSFAIAQLTDLIFIEFVYSKQYPMLIDPYFMKVGDDLVLQDPDMKFTSWYEKIGVPINLSKSKFKTDYGSFVEFVSRNSWNGLDYSVVSPRLVSKFLRNDYYLIVLFNHIKERMIGHPSATELLSEKNAIQMLKSNFDSNKAEARTTKLLKITKLFDIINPSPVLTGGEFTWSPNKEEVLLLLENMILVTLGEYCWNSEIHNSTLGDDPTTLSSKELLGEFAILNKDHLESNDTKNFYKVCLSNKLTFREIVTLRQAMPILRLKEEKLHQGTIKSLQLQNGLVSFPQPLIEVAGTWIANPEFIEFILRQQDLLTDATQGYKTLRKGPMFDRNSTASTLNLYRLMNSIIDLESKILDIDNGQYSQPKGVKVKAVSVNPDLIRGYTKLFMYSDMFKQIEQLRSDPVVLVSLFPDSTAARVGENEDC